MGIGSRIKTVIKKAIRHNSQTIVPLHKQSEQEFYTELFVKNNTWNTPNPNLEEEKRWRIIDKFIFYILGYRARNGLDKELNILDLGCGRGWLTNLLAPYGAVTGIEPIKPVVDYAKTLFPSLDFRYGTTDDLISKGKDKEYDLIVCSEVIEHIPDQEKRKFLSDIYLLLKPRGFLIITTPRKDAQLEWLKYGTPGQPIEEWLSESELSLLLEESFFRKHYLSRFALPPTEGAPLIEIYQLWLIQRV